MMPFILHIETAFSIGSVCLSQANTMLQQTVFTEPNNHASCLHQALQSLLTNNSLNWNQIDAIAVSIGPGSYTGLRVGLATAKGLCFAINKPLLTINTLEMLTQSAIAQFGKINQGLYCPLIDARRMEVFTALFDQHLHYTLPQTNLVIDPHSFETTLAENKIVFFGNGSPKCKPLLAHQPNAIFLETTHSAQNMMALALQKYVQSDFANLASCVPNYGKPFYTTQGPVI